jgi:FkbM family methyltransferase
MSFHSTLTKYLRAYPQWHFSPPRVQTIRRVERFGSEYGGYFLDPRLVPPSPVVYSLGVGEDISFDLALIKRFGCTVHAFDPTPKVKSWIGAESLPPQFVFHPIGIAEHDGEAEFFLPPRADFISHSIVRARQYSDRSIQVPVSRLSTVMAELGHSEIDILKMDIEGAEYSVLTDVMKAGIPIKQVVAEFHHRLTGFGTRKTKEVIVALNARGMKMCYVCPRLEVFTFVREAEAYQ